MILQPATILCLCCLVLQQVRAEYYNSTQPTIWDLFNWKITVQRQRQDEITLKGLLEVLVKQENVTIPGAKCNETEEWTGETGRPGFVMHCKCNLSSSTFDAKLMSCVANSELKQGCQFTTGSWRWSTSWRWDTVDDALIVLDKKHDYGITTGFNATTTVYQSCSLDSLSYWAEDMGWTEASESFFNHSKPTMFKLHNMWHLSWIIKNMQNEVKKSLKGKILKFPIECEKPGPPQNEDEELEISSCLLVKVTGQLTVKSKYWERSQNATVNTTARPTEARPTEARPTEARPTEARPTEARPTEARPTATSDLDGLLISLLIPLAIILLIVGALIAVCYIRRTACFAGRESSRHVTVLNDVVIETKLIKNPADESIV